MKYWDVIRALGGEGYTVLTFDHRSQGFSGRTVEPHDMSHVEDFERYVKDALEVLEERVFKVGEGTRKISIVGHSMGGWKFRRHRAVVPGKVRKVHLR